MRVFAHPALALLALAATAAACGAKTGLDTPDVPWDIVDATDASDATDTPPPNRVCLLPMPDGGLYHLTLRTAAQVAVADVLFVIDRTGSMDQEIDNVRRGLRTIIVPGLIRAIPDLHLGLVTYGDFPVDPYGAPEDVPFTLERAASVQFTALQGAIANVQANGGGDNPEALVEALYQVATGEGLQPFIRPSGGCPSIGVGYACMRTRAQPIIMVVTDAPMHNGPAAAGDVNAYSRTAFSFPYTQPHTYDQMLSALITQLHPRVIGINSGLEPFSGRAHLERLARDTGTLGANGRPLVFDIGPDGSGLSEQVVASVQRLTAEVRMNVSARVVDDGSGASAMVREVRPIAAMPMNQVDRLDATTFYNVVPGTQLSFELLLDASLTTPIDVEQRFTVRIEFLADGRPTLGSQDVLIIVPARGSTCTP